MFLNSNLGGKLLWTNPSPTSALAKTVIEVDYSNYSKLKFVIKVSLTDNTEFEFIPPTKDTFVIGHYFPGEDKTYDRTINIGTNKITINNSHVYGNNGIVNNGTNIVTAIYGIN